MPMIRNNKGMTLLEIMIVLVILGGLIAILATSVQGSLKKAKMRQAKIQIAEYGKALDMYYQDCNNYPSTDEGLQALMQAPPSCSNWGPDPYLKKLNKDPWGGDFSYESQGNAYVLKSFGSDKREGGSGDAQDVTNE
ncbi:MAG: type II secretion system major pseudopilin GspG [Bdellovibrionales bacterium]|nr:type II secretion system major pseudopilin GspG [Bdellovibrionales bacterium]